MGWSSAIRYKVTASDDHGDLSVNKHSEQNNPPQIIEIKSGSVVVSRPAPRQYSHQRYGRILRRLVGFGAALLFLHISSSASVEIWDLLVGKQQDFRRVLFYVSPLMLPFMGTATVGSSPFVFDVMANCTTPRNSTIYLRSEFETSTVDCGKQLAVPGMYTDSFHRHLFTRIMADTQYNLTFLQKYELVTPIIDSTFSGLVLGDSTALRLFYVVREIAHPDEVGLIAVIMQTVDYQLINHNVNGPALLGTLALLRDLQATQVQHYFVLGIGYPSIELSLQAYEYVDTTTDSFWVLKSIPSSTSQVIKLLRVACRQGIYIDSEREQSNIANLIWPLDQDPLKVVSELRYMGRPSLHNSWAWMHGLHFFLTASMVHNLLLLVLVSSNNFVDGNQLWLGDAILALHSSLWMLLPVVLVSWASEGFWTLFEFCIRDGNAITTTQDIFLYESIVRADLMVLCVSLADLLGRVTKHRIEPALAIVTFNVFFQHRLTILQWIPVLARTVTSYTEFDYLLAIKDDPAISIITSMRLWSVHELQFVPIRFVLAALAPIFGSYLGCMVGYILLRKSLRRMFHRHRRPHIHRRSTANDTDATRLALLTLFEAATGNELLERSGVVTDYDNFVMVGNSRFASDDGVFSCGFVIADNRFLVQIGDLWRIWIIKVTGVQFTDIYVYEIKHHEVQQRARLVYPSTIPARDLLRLKVHQLL